MPLVTLSNPRGLDLAILGNPRRRRGRGRLRLGGWRIVSPRRRRNPDLLASTKRKAGLGISRAARSILGGHYGIPTLRRRSRKAGKKGSTMAVKTRKHRKAKGRRRVSIAFLRRIGRKGGKARARRIRKAYRAGRGVGKWRRGRTWRLGKRGRRIVKILRARSGKFKKKAYGRPTIKSGRKGTIRVRARVWRKGKRGSRIRTFTNPGRGLIANYFGGLTSVPNEIMATFKSRNMLSRAGWMAGGVVGTYILGGIVAKTVSGLIEKVPGGATLMANPIAKRVVSGLVPYTVGFVGAKFVKNPNLRFALLTGGAVAGVVSMLFPDAISNIMAKLGMSRFLPGVSGLGAYRVLAGHFGDDALLAGYVQAPAYQGTEGYVQAPNYQGTEGYVQAPSYQGTEGYMDASNYLNQPSYLASI